MQKVLCSLATLLSAVDARNYLRMPQFADESNSSVIAQPLADNSTFGNTEFIRTEHLDLTLTADFEYSTLNGTAKHTMEVIADTTIAQFDIWDLDILAVWDVNNDDLAYEILEGNPDIGEVLQVNLGQTYKAGAEVVITVNYNTQKDGQAFSWLTAEQTAGKKMPYMFTQCEDINCRSVAPLQDTPSNRITYSAKIYAKYNVEDITEQFVVKVSANETSTSGKDMGNGYRVYTFECSIPIPSYLIAIAIGDIEYRSTGTRTGVMTEPCAMDAVAEELADMGTMLDNVEAYMGPYIWGIYNILVLPPSFPMGGMENPLLTFASPTVIVGDKSQVYVAIHEMAHSWTGNEVTCQNWENFWLNEGFTVFVERHVSATMYGEDFAKVAALLGNTSMYQSMEDQELGLKDTFSSLHPVLKGRNPDSSFSTVPYEKGFQMLYFLEQLIGDAQMQAFLNYYMSEHKLTSITTVQLRASWEYFVGNMIPDLTG